MPAAARGEEGRRFLQWDCEGETTVYVDGEPWAGLDLAHRTCPLPDRRDHAVARLLDVADRHLGARPRLRARSAAYGLRFDACGLRVRDPLAWSVSWDLDVFIQLVARAAATRRRSPSPPASGTSPPLESCSPLLRRVLRGLDDACDAFVDGGLPALQRALQRWRARCPAEAWQPVAALCGHAHIDLVWLWPEMATERKGVHGFATQLRLLERYPEMTFVQSQPALYRAVERRAPALMRQIRRRIREGRWEAMGGFEVEPDTNLPSGEALARSLVYGQRKIARAGARDAPPSRCAGSRTSSATPTACRRSCASAASTTSTRRR